MNTNKAESSRPTYPGYCSFCRRSYRDVGPLAEGPDQVYICYECTQACAKVITKEKEVIAMEKEGRPRNEDEGTTLCKSLQEVAFLQGQCSSRTNLTAMAGLSLAVLSAVTSGVSIILFNLSYLVASSFCGGIGTVSGGIAACSLAAWITNYVTRFEIRRTGIQHGSQRILWKEITRLSPICSSGKVAELLIYERNWIGRARDPRVLCMDNQIDIRTWAETAVRIEGYLTSIGCNTVIDNGS